MENLVCQFLRERLSTAEAIENERGLQVEIGLMYRQHNLNVRFEVSCDVPHNPQHTRPQKRDIDILVSDGARRLAIELKVPLAGRVPETMFDFCADIAFLEAVVSSGVAHRGACILVTNDSKYWSGRSNDGIYRPFRTGVALHGQVTKPTGQRDTVVYLAGSYRFSWVELANEKLLSGGRYLMTEVVG